MTAMPGPQQSATFYTILLVSTAAPVVLAAAVVAAKPVFSPSVIAASLCVRKVTKDERRLSVVALFAPAGTDMKK